MAEFCGQHAIPGPWHCTLWERRRARGRRVGRCGDARPSDVGRLPKMERPGGGACQRVVDATQHDGASQRAVSGRGCPTHGSADGTVDGKGFRVHADAPCLDLARTQASTRHCAVRLQQSPSLQQAARGAIRPRAYGWSSRCQLTSLATRTCSSPTRAYAVCARYTPTARLWWSTTRRRQHMPSPSV